MKAISEMTVAELGAFTATYLKENGVRVVLSGGACVTIYGDGQYVTGDIDFVVRGVRQLPRVSALLSELGFCQKRGRLFSHPETKILIGTNPEPLSVGAEPVLEIKTLKFSTGELDAISATDCVKDRLAKFYHWNDYQSRVQAISVAKNSTVDLQEVKRWSEKEGAVEKFEAFLRDLQKSN
ncbi:MAG: hypothetical protein ISS74_04875 [Planctomycetes bacterium]|nr:hypothetical protein [Planctomycetota bacterium]